MKGEILIPDYIIQGKKHLDRQINKEKERPLKDRILIAITVIAGIGLWLSCKAIEFGDARAVLPEVVLIVCTAWIIVFIYAQERDRI